MEINNHKIIYEVKFSNSIYGFHGDLEPEKKYGVFIQSFDSLHFKGRINVFEYDETIYYNIVYFIEKCRKGDLHFLTMLRIPYQNVLFEDIIMHNVKSNFKLFLTKELARNMVNKCKDLTTDLNKLQFVEEFSTKSYTKKSIKDFCIVHYDLDSKNLNEFLEELGYEDNEILLVKCKSIKDGYTLYIIPEQDLEKHKSILGHLVGTDSPFINDEPNSISEEYYVKNNMYKIITSSGFFVHFNKNGYLNYLNYKNSSDVWKKFFYSNSKYIKTIDNKQVVFEVNNLAKAFLYAGIIIDLLKLNDIVLKRPSYEITSILSIINMEKSFSELNENFSDIITLINSHMHKSTIPDKTLDEDYESLILDTVNRRPLKKIVA